LRDLRIEGTAAIYISHRLEEIFSVADRVTVLRDGESVGTNQVDDITEAQLIRMMVGREVSTIYPAAESEPGEPALELRNLGCCSSGVRDVNLEVRAGEVLGLAGLIGAGRTELARILFGITPADSGEIIFCGERISIKSPRDAVAHGIAYVPEDRRRHGVIPEMAVATNITMAILPELFPGGWLRFQAERKTASRYVQDLAIKTADVESSVATLSGGNQQKVALARWLATKPKLLILDEPTQGVDVGAKAEIHKLIRRLTAQGMAVLMISSDLPEIVGMSDRIAVMRVGTISAILPGKSDPHRVMAAAIGGQP
jgi:rhamnose transport system ATP-binding protein